MSKPLDQLGNPISVGSTIIYVGAGYTTFKRGVVSKLNPKTVNIGDKTQWDSYTRRAFDSVIVVDAIESLEKKAEKLDALEAGGVDNWSGYWFSLEEAGLTGGDE